MSGESFLSSALRLFSVSDPTDSETAAISGEAGSSIEKPHGQGIANAGGDAVQSEANEAATSSEPAHLSIRASASVRGSVRAGEKFWEDEAATPRLSAPSAAGTPTLVSTPGTSATDAVAVLPPGMVSARRLAEFTRCLEAKSVNSESLRRLAWFGVPSRYRTAVWQILLGYLPASADRVQDSLARKRAEYEGFVAAVSGRGGLAKGEGEQRMLRQVLVDCPRTCPGIPLFHSAWVQRSLAKVLTVYATRHFATGYVQGINDLACPFYAVFLSPWADLDSGDDVLATIPAQDLAEVEADVYWCLTRTLEGIQSHYLASQPGLHSMMAGLRDLCFRIDGKCASVPPCTHLAIPPAPSLPHAPLLHCRATGSAPGEERRGVQDLQLPLDELPPHA